MWRDRTNLFISYRQSYSHHPSKKPRFGPSNGFSEPSSLPLTDERRGLMSAGAYEDDGDVVIEMDLLPPRWLDIQDEVTEALVQIASETRKLEQLHQKHILPGFDDEDVKKKEEREIERITQSITRKFQECQTSIKRIDSLIKEAKDHGGVNQTEETMAKNLKISLAARVGEVSANYRKKQSAYLKKLRALGGFTSPNMPGTPLPGANPLIDPSMLESEADRSFSQSTLQQTQQRRFHDNDSAITQREREIDELAQGIIDLSTIFQEMQSMVIDQGSMLDRIDYNVERMATEMKAADKELTVATGYQKRSIKRKIMLLLILIIAGMFILLGLKLSSKKSAAAPLPPSAPNSDPSPGKRLLAARDFTGLYEDSQIVPRHILLKREWRRRRRRSLGNYQVLNLA